MTDSRQDIATPTPAVVRGFLRQWDDAPELARPDAALSLLFRVLCPANVEMSGALLKVAALNQLYGTRLFRVRDMAGHILELDVDAKLREGSRDVVAEIAKLDLPGGKTRRFLSFATKYCSFHRPECYAIYDRHSRTALGYFLHVGGFATCKPSRFNDYEVFHGAVEAFREFYGLQEFTLKDIDRYLWQVGRILNDQEPSKENGA